MYSVGFSAYRPTEFYLLISYKVGSTNIKCYVAGSCVDAVWDVCDAGAQIIDLMLLVVDITKGIQTQTAECLVIGEITCDKMIIVLNKIDLIEPAKRPSTIDRVSIFFWHSDVSFIHLFMIFYSVVIWRSSPKSASIKWEFHVQNLLDADVVSVIKITSYYIRCSIKKEPLTFDYNCRISWSIFIILAPMETGMNTPQYHVIYLLDCFMTS